MGSPSRPGHSPQTWLPPQPALGVRAGGEGGGLDHPGKVASQRHWNRNGETGADTRGGEGRYGSGQRTERQTRKTNKVTILGTGEETERPQRVTGALETRDCREGRERKRYSARDSETVRGQEKKGKFQGAGGDGEADTGVAVGRTRWKKKHPW